MQSFKSRLVVAFDLDDTLYPEADYVRSGIRWVGRQLEKLTQKSLTPNIQDATANWKGDWVSGLCAAAGLPLACKESLLWMYRLHEPDISLSSQCACVLEELRRRCQAIAIITDGRSVTQRKKVQALGLSDIPLYVSEDYSSEKPDPYRFRLVEMEYPADRYFYVGDNPRKDFLAGNSLGWTTIGVRRAGGVHSQEIEGLEKNCLPSVWVNDLGDLLSVLE